MNNRDADTADTPVLDAAIDRAVRRMVQVDPASGLRHRVRMQIDRGDAAAPLFFHARLAVAASVLALLLIAAVLVNRDGAGVKPAPAPPVTQAATQVATQPATEQA